jgi:acyl-CoA hydrolase
LSSNWRQTLLCSISAMMVMAASDRIDFASPIHEGEMVELNE